MANAVKSIWKRKRWLVLAGAGGVFLALSIGVYHFWQARVEASINLSRKLVGRWAAGSDTDSFMGVPSMSLTGGVICVKGRAGQALLFAFTTGRVSVPDKPAFAVRAGQDFSVMAWINPREATTSFGVMSIVEKRKVGGILTARGYSLHLEYGRLACQLTPRPGFQLTWADVIAPKRWPTVWQSRNALAPANRFVSPGPSLFDGRFHHVALTLQRHSTTGGKLYVDGKVVLTFDPTKLRGSFVNSEPLLIGTHPDSTLDCGFRGLIEDVRLYSRALSQAEVETAASQ